MQFVEMGLPKGTAKTLMLLPGTGCTFELNFKNVIEHFASEYHLICVNYDGFETDHSIRTDFTDMLTITGKLEEYILKNYDGRIDACYGSSLGGSFVGLLLERNKVHIDHGFLGGSDLDEGSKFAARFMTLTVGRILENYCRDDKKLEKFKKSYINGKKDMDEERKKATGEFLSLFSACIKDLKPGTLCAEYYSDYSTHLGCGIDVPGTKVHVIYAVQMGAKYEKRYLKHFKNPDIKRFDMSHESWLFAPAHTKEVLEYIDSCLL